MHDKAIEKLREWLRGQFGAMLTEPLTASALADYFGVHREKMAKILKSMDGVERMGKSWRVPIWKMTPKYWLEAGLIEPIRLSDLSDFDGS